VNGLENRILLVEDDDRICRQLVRAMEDASIPIDVCGTLSEASEQLSQGYALILLDLGLPDGHGLDLCRKLRANGDHTPIIVLTARNMPADRVRGLEAGADDYVAKPFYLPELFARINAVSRRMSRATQDGRLSCGKLWLDPGSRTTGIGDQILQLKRREFELLEFLMRQPGRTWTRAQILEQVWDTDFLGDERTVDLHIARLRALVEKRARRPRMIETVWGIGYRFTESS
jgi:DNA-binding response OmpR family regulator